MTKILVINGSYRENGITDQVITTIVEELETAGADVEITLLRDYPIEFCLNCRKCTQQPGSLPGECVQDDAMQKLINKIEESNAFILASPTNFGSVTALFQRFLERLVVYSYWPWDKNYPKYRKANVSKKKALLISSCAAPGILGGWIYGTRKQLKTTAQIIGANPVGILFSGLIAKDSHHRISEKVQAKAKALAIKLL